MEKLKNMDELIAWSRYTDDKILKTLSDDESIYIVSYVLKQAATRNNLEIFKSCMTRLSTEDKEKVNKIYSEFFNVVATEPHPDASYGEDYKNLRNFVRNVLDTESIAHFVDIFLEKGKPFYIYLMMSNQNMTAEILKKVLEYLVYNCHKDEDFKYGNQNFPLTYWDWIFIGIKEFKNLNLDLKYLLVMDVSDDELTEFIIKDDNIEIEPLDEILNASSEFSEGIINLAINRKSEVKKKLIKS
ncbi:hypothetical protein K9U64_22430 [Providencia stuartii]|uniref:hypothetical protein n=2 Tax=Providencia stuartii TaxID=588 RepID=UPI003317F935